MSQSKWVITNKRGEASPLIGMEPLFRTMSTYTANALKSKLKTEFMIEFSGGTASMAAIENDWRKYGEITVEFLKEEEFFLWLIKGLEDEAINLNQMGSLLRKMSFDNLSNSELLKFLESSFSNLLEFFKYNHIVNSSDFYHDEFTKFLYQMLNKYSSKCDELNISIGNAYSILTTPDKEVWIQEQEFDLCHLACLFSSDLQNLNTDFNQSIEKFTEKYFWIEYEQQGLELTKEDFIIKFHEFINAHENPSKEMDELLLRRSQMKTRRIELEKDLNLSQSDLYFFRVARTLVYWKLHLREIKVRFYSCVSTLIEECGKRLSITPAEVRFLTQKELIKLLNTNTRPNQDELKERLKYCVLKFTNDETFVLTGDEAKRSFSLVDDSNIMNNQTTISGFCGYPGSVEGYVSKVLTLNDVGGFRDGNILTAYMTDISIVPAMKRAKAIVTDVGGVTCHAAIIAREFKIPCVIGTKQITSIFQNGDYIYVDADNGKIRMIEPFDEYKKSRLDEKVQDISVHIKLSPHLNSVYTPISLIRNVTPLTKFSFGGKAESLSVLINNSFPTPDGIVLSNEVFNQFITDNKIVDKINSILSSISQYSELEKAAQKIKQLITNGEFNNNVLTKLYSIFDSFGFNKVAVRSSAPTEDSLEASWAGQFDSYLNVSREELITSIQNCWASCFSARSLSYRSDLNENKVNLSLAVIIQEMIHSKISGTAFSINPVNNNSDELIVESCIGLGESLVSGKITPITYLVRKSDGKIIEKRVEFQETAIFSENNIDGVKQESLNNKIKYSQFLPNEIFDKLVDTILKIEKKYNTPVDIEWAFDGQDIYIVQCRPITTL